MQIVLVGVVVVVVVMEGALEPFLRWVDLMERLLESRCGERKGWKLWGHRGGDLSPLACPATLLACV